MLSDKNCMDNQEWFLHRIFPAVTLPWDLSVLGDQDCIDTEGVTPTWDHSQSLHSHGIYQCWMIRIVWILRR